MIQIRKGTFETNSSSVHSIVICTKKQFEDWKNNRCFFNINSEQFAYPELDKIEEYRKEAVEQYKRTKDPDPYSINWDKLSSESQERYIESHVKYRLSQDHIDNCVSYDYYRYYYESSCKYSEVLYTTEHGDEIVVFGKGGYDG